MEATMLKRAIWTATTVGWIHSGEWFFKVAGAVPPEKRICEAHEGNSGVERNMKTTIDWGLGNGKGNGNYNN